jgi:LmbE family N-acetylglucosaminyl deacetylase
MLNNLLKAIYVPDHEDPLVALSKTTHLAVGAHQDDIEIMAIDGILACYQNADQHFTACTVTDGRGTPRAGAFENVSDAEMAEIRANEQNKAAEIGKYAAQVQLGFQSHQVRQPDFKGLADSLDQLFSLTRPKIVYTHNLFDKHSSHVAVALRVIEAIRRMSPETRPEKLYGCEVWRALDFLPDEKKVLFDVSAEPDLQSALLTVYESQIAGGKNYEQAVIGRRIANATFQDPYQPDQASRISIAMDLSPLIHNDDLSVPEFTRALFKALETQISQTLAGLLGQ